MKPKFEKNIFIKRIINNGKFPKGRIISNSNIITSIINNKSYKINPKQCYIKPHPIFIISNLYKKNKCEINIHPNHDQNFIYIKAKNCYNSERFKRNKYEDESNTTRSKSFDIAPFEHIDKIKKYFNNNMDKIKYKYNISSLNSFDNNKSLRNDTSTDNITYYRNKYNTMNNIERNNHNIKYKSSKSKDIIKLCKVLKNLYNNNEIILKEKKEKRNIMNINEDTVKKIIVIQKWWKEMIYKKYLKKKIINIQKMFRSYIFRKKFLQILCLLQKFSSYEYLNKIIFIQRYWKNYLMNNKLISMSFSFTNNEDNNNTNHKDIIYIDNNNSNNKSDLNNSSNKKINPNHIKNKILLKSCLYTKKYYSNIASIFSDIILIQKSFKKYLFNKQKNNIKTIQKIYHKKSLKNKKTNSRNDNENIDKAYIKKKDNFKSLIIVSPEKEFETFQYHTPKKEKLHKIKFDEMIIKNTNKELLFHKKVNNICLIRKIRKDINIDIKIKFLQKNIIQFLKNSRKSNLKCTIKDINNICFIDKIYGCNIISHNLKNKINLLQIKIKKFLKRINNEINSPISKKLKSIKINNINLSKEIFESTNDNSINYNISNNQKNTNNITEFTPDEANNKNNKNENIFISTNLNTFSFDFKNIKNEDIEDDDTNINMVSPKIQNTNKTINFSSKNRLVRTERYYSYKKLKRLFISNITNKFANYLMNILHKLHLYNFIKLFFQKINKSINQYVYFCIFDKKNEKNEILFFTILKRHIIYNMKNTINNEIKSLLIENIPKSFQYHNDELSSICIPYLNQFQEKNLINTQLFINNDDNLVNYFNNFYNNENDRFQINPTLLKNILNKYKLNNRNIYTLTRYFDDVIKLLKNNKLCTKCLCLNINCICGKINNNQSNFNYIKKRCNYLGKLYKKKKEKEKEKKENINDEFFNMIDEEGEAYSYDNEFVENDNDKYLNKTLSNSYIINTRKNYLFTYHNDNIQDNHEYKFFDYLNEKSKNNRYNETVPITSRDNCNSLIKI